MEKLRWVIGGVFVLISGCTVRETRGVVAMKISPTEAHVCVGENEVQTGQEARLFKNKCKMVGKAQRCEKVLVGTGTLTQKLNEHYSVMRFPQATDFYEGDVVEFGPPRNP